MSAIESMFNQSRLMDRFFRKVPNVVWDMMSGGKLGVRTKDGIVTLEMTGTAPDLEFQTVENPFDQMGFSVPAFAMQTPLSAVEPGNLIVKGSTTGWVTKVNAKSVSILKPDGTHTPWTPPKTQMLDFGSGIMVVKSLFNMMPGGQAAVGGLQGMLMPMLMSGMLDEDGLDSMMPMMLMMSGALTNTGNPDDAAKAAQMGFGPQMMQQMMPMMMMASMMKKGGSGLDFGGNPKRPFRA